MAKFLEKSVEIDTSSMTTEELENFQSKLTSIVDTLTIEIKRRKILEHRHPPSFNS